MESKETVKPQRLIIDKGVFLYKRDSKFRVREYFEKYVWIDLSKMETGDTYIVRLPEQMSVNYFLRVLKLVSKRKTGKSMRGNGIRLVRTASKDSFIFLKI